MTSNSMSLSKAYDTLIAYFEAQKQENRIFDLGAAQAFIEDPKARVSIGEPKGENLSDVLREVAKTATFMTPENLGISTALDRTVVNLRQIKDLNIEQGLFLVHKNIKMETGSAYRNLSIEPGSTMLGAKPPMPSIGRELLADKDGMKVAIAELKLALEGNRLDSGQDSYGRLSGISSAFGEILDSVNDTDFITKLSFFAAAQKQGYIAPAKGIH